MELVGKMDGCSSMGENRFLDSSNLREDANLNNMEQSENVNKTQMKSASRMPNTCTLGKATGASPSDNDSSSPGVSSSIPVVSSEARSKLAKDDLAVEVSSRRPGAAPRSHSNPKERLSLPNTGKSLGSQSAKAIIRAGKLTQTSAKNQRRRNSSDPIKQRLLA